MRTTLTLDPDVAAELERRRRAGRGLKEEVNRLLRVGLLHDRQEAALKPATWPTFDMGASRVGSLDNVAEVLAHVEGQDHR